MKYVYTTGAFDLFHIGHLQLLERASRFGSLVVGVMSDEFIRRTKGASPIIPYWQRARIVEALECVDHAGMVTDHIDYNLIDKYPISIRIVGPNYGELIGHTEAIAEMARRDIRIVCFSRTSGISTTAIKEKIRGQGGCNCGCGMEGCRTPDWPRPCPGDLPAT